MKFFEKIVSNTNLNTSRILANSSIWDGWLGPEFASAGEQNTAFTTQAEIFLWQQVKMTIKTTVKSICAATLKDICSEIFLQIIIKVSVVSLYVIKFRLTLIDIDVHIDIDFARPFFFTCPIGRASKIRARKIGRVEANLSSPVW